MGFKEAGGCDAVVTFEGSGRATCELLGATSAVGRVRLASAASANAATTICRGLNLGSLDHRGRPGVFTGVGPKLD
jgi:hypothetical protein